MNHQSLVAVSRLATEDIDAWLAAPTDQTCPHCGTQHLARFESLNGRCERCRIRYAEQAGWWRDAMCGCALRTGEICRDGLHFREDYDHPESRQCRVALSCRSPLTGRESPERCPAWSSWWSRTVAEARRQKRGRLLGD